MAVKSHEIVIVFGKGGRKCELVLRAGKKDDQVKELRLDDPPPTYDGIKIVTSKPGKNKDVVDPKSLEVWKKAEKAIKLLQVTDQPDTPDSGDAVCFETRRGWYCVE